MPEQNPTGTPDESVERPASDGAATVPAPAQSESRDERPRPRYGEYAPEGWTWTPPADGHAPASPTPAPAVWAAPPQGALAGRGPSAASGRLARPERRADRAVTILLLVIGVLGAWLSVGVLQALPQSMQLLHTQEGIQAYTPGPEIPGLILAGSIVQVVLWVVTATGSIVLMRARRPSFWLPLVGGVVAAIALFVFMLVAITGDPVLLDHMTTTRA
jgi:Family of unknown function (DUF6264)